MSKSLKVVVLVSGVVAAAILAVVAVVQGRDGLEMASWICGIGSFALAAVTLVVALRPATTDTEPERSFTATASGNGTILQAGRDIRDSGNGGAPKRRASR